MAITTSCYVKNSKCTPEWFGCAMYEVTGSFDGPPGTVGTLYHRRTTTPGRVRSTNSWDLFAFVASSDVRVAVPKDGSDLSLVVGRRDGINMGYSISRIRSLPNPWTGERSESTAHTYKCVELDVVPMYPTAFRIADLIRPTLFHKPGGDGSAPEIFSLEQHEHMLW